MSECVCACARVARPVPRACVLPPPPDRRSAPTVNVRACVSYLGLPRLKGKSWPPGPRTFKKNSVTPLPTPVEAISLKKGRSVRCSSALSGAVLSSSPRAPSRTVAALGGGCTGWLTHVRLNLIM